MVGINKPDTRIMSRPLVREGPQVKSIDFRARKAKLIGKASGGVLDTVLSILDACIY